MTRVELRPIAAAERDAFLAMLGDYLEELDAYELDWGLAPTAEAYRDALEADPGGNQVEWVLAGSERAGFLVTRVVPDWPEEQRRVGEILECYIVPGQRGRGVGRAAVEVWFARMRGRGVALVEASVLWRNAPARGFWERLGFEVRAVQTVRRP